MNIRTDILERKSDILNWIEEKYTLHEIAKQLNCKIDTLRSWLKKMGIEYHGNKGKRPAGSSSYLPASYYINNNKPLASDKLKKKLLKEGIKEARCECCGLTTWQGKQIPLELHHINGNHFDNHLDNLQILCPNCHALKDNNSGKNVKAHRVKLADLAE